MSKINPVQTLLSISVQCMIKANLVQKLHQITDDQVKQLSSPSSNESSFRTSQISLLFMSTSHFVFVLFPQMCAITLQNASHIIHAYESLSFVILALLVFLCSNTVHCRVIQCLKLITIKDEEIQVIRLISSFSVLGTYKGNLVKFMINQFRTNQKF